MRFLKTFINLFIMLALSYSYGNGKITKNNNANKHTLYQQTTLSEKADVGDDASKEFKQVGLATYYSKKMHGRRTASGEKIYNDSFACAHRTLPFGTMLNVYCPTTDKTVTVKVIDRGPFTRGRIIDLSWAAAQELGIIAHGSTKVIITKCPETTPSDSIKTANK